MISKFQGQDVLIKLESMLMKIMTRVSGLRLLFGQRTPDL